MVFLFMLISDKSSYRKYTKMIAYALNIWFQLFLYHILKGFQPKDTGFGMIITSRKKENNIQFSYNIFRQKIKGFTLVDN